ncbi:glycosyltransferase family 2 protein [Echinimonas agarilytica]|uniref:Glycosyltransferase family 2 protein n=1 Tax=Echinimonas agarilytica TaxID=1215918 RepID=A0AA41W800_9GAMM|nr:glycosyltransferase family 2 protein [Echinimonas agarilytica]MCM2680118.1 glycosyltransferase family 2 protein [Echinimonas agarilytica]
MSVKKNTFSEVVYVAVVSHGHGKIIEEMCCLEHLSKPQFVVIVIDNIREKRLCDWSKDNNVDYLYNHKPLGFGHNNNLAFAHARTLGMRNQDLFLILNPDVKVDSSELRLFISDVVTRGSGISTVNLFRDQSFTHYDNSIRRFPSLFDFMSSFLGFRNRTIYDKDKIDDVTHVDWAAGSFLLFSVEIYELLRGFDTRYFMYCEDVDICYRARRDFNIPVTFFPGYKALHLAAHANKKILSRHFWWHLTSAITFLSVKRFRRKKS